MGSISFIPENGLSSKTIFFSFGESFFLISVGATSVKVGGSKESRWVSEVDNSILGPFTYIIYGGFYTVIL